MVSSGIVSLLWLSLAPSLVIAGEGAAPLPFGVTGRVLNPDGRPFAGFTMIAEPFSFEETANWTAHPSTVTGADGRFCIELPPAKTFYHVRGVGPDGRTSSPVEIASSDAGGFVDLGTMNAEPIERWLTGAVIDGSGEPLAGAAVSVMVSWTYHFLLTSNEHGRFVVGGVAPGSYVSLQARSGDRVSCEVDLDPATASPADVRLQIVPSTSASGIIADEDGSPIEGATVIGEVPAPSGKDRQVRSAATTNARGEFVLGPFPVQSTSLGKLTVFAEGFTSKVSGLDWGPSPHRIVVEPAGEIRGRAARSDGMTPVRVVSVIYSEVPIRDHQLQATDDGNFRVRFGAESNLFPTPAIRRECWLRADGFAPARVVFGKHASRDQRSTVVFEEGRSREIVVVDSNGRPVAGASIEARFAAPIRGDPLSRAKTDASGRCRLEHLPDTPIEIDVLPTFGQPFTQIDSVVVTGKETEPLRIELSLGGFLEGVITDDGRPMLDPRNSMGGAQLEFSSSRDGVGTLDLDVHLHFRSAALAPGEYSIVGGSCFLFPDDYELWVDEEKVAEPGEAWKYRISIRDGRTHHVELRLN